MELFVNVILGVKRYRVKVGFWVVGDSADGDKIGLGRR